LGGGDEKGGQLLFLVFPFFLAVFIAVIFALAPLFWLQRPRVCPKVNWPLKIHSVAHSSL